MTPEPTFEESIAAFPDAARFEALRDRLAASGAGDLDLTWFTHETPLGTLLFAAHDARIVRVAFERENFDAVKEHLQDRFGVRMLRTDIGFGTLRRELDEYFGGRGQALTAPVDFALSSGPFRVQVQRWLPHIHYGTTVTYRDLAADVGRPAAVRAAASACATNPVPILVPCHRVVRSDGAIGDYLGGPEAKAWLLELEGAAPR